MTLGTSNFAFFRPLWRGFVIAPPITVLGYIAMQMALSGLGIVAYDGPADEEFYMWDPAITAISFVALSIVAYTMAIPCGLLLIHVLRKLRRLSTLPLIVGAAFLGSIVLPIAIALSHVLSVARVGSWRYMLTWGFCVGAAAGAFTAIVFCYVVRFRYGSEGEQG